MEVAAEILLLLRSLLWPAAGAGCHHSPVRCSRAATTVMLSDFTQLEPGGQQGPGAAPAVG